jgi:hypothetical protein
MRPTTLSMEGKGSFGPVASGRSMETRYCAIARSSSAQRDNPPYLA